MHGPALIGSALFLYQFLAHRCAILYTRLFSLFFSRRILFFHPEESERLQGRPAYAAASPGAKRAKQTLFRLIFGGHLVYRFFFRDGLRRPPLLPPFGEDPKAGFLQKVRSAPSFRPASACRKPCRLWTARRNCAHPPLYTARPICWLTFPLGSDTISIKHRKGRPAPWPSS